MGRTLPSATQIMQQDEAALTRFRRALRRSDQLILDDLFNAAQKLEEHKEVLRLRESVEKLLNRYD